MERLTLSMAARQAVLDTVRPEIWSANAGFNERLHKIKITLDVLVEHAGLQDELAAALNEAALDNQLAGMDLSSAVDQAIHAAEEMRPDDDGGTEDD